MLLIEYLSHIRTRLVVTKTRLTFLTLAYDFLIIIFIRRSSIFVLLTGALLECLIVGVTWVMAVSNYRLLKCVSVRVISDVLLWHHQPLIGMLGRVSLTILHTEGISYINSVVCFTCEVA